MNFTKSLGRAAACAGALPLLLLGACASTVTGSENVAHADPAAFLADGSDFPTEFHGAAPGHTTPQLAALFHGAGRLEYASLTIVPPQHPSRWIVFYVNAATLPAPRDLCSGPGGFVSGPQSGARASVTAVLCGNGDVISRADGLVRTASDATLHSGFLMMKDEAIDALFPVTEGY